MAHKVWPNNSSISFINRCSGSGLREAMPNTNTYCQTYFVILHTMNELFVHDGILSVTDFLFLDASSHLYKRVCPSVRPSVRNAFFLIAEIDNKQHRIIGKVETLFLDCNNLQKNFKTKF